MKKNLSWERLETWESESTRESPCPIQKTEKWTMKRVWTLNIIRLNLKVFTDVMVVNDNVWS